MGPFGLTTISNIRVLSPHVLTVIYRAEAPIVCDLFPPAEPVWSTLLFHQGFSVDASNIYRVEDG